MSASLAANAHRADRAGALAIAASWARSSPRWASADALLALALVHRDRARWPTRHPTQLATRRDDSPTRRDSGAGHRPTRPEELGESPPRPGRRASDPRSIFPVICLRDNPVSCAASACVSSRAGRSAESPESGSTSPAESVSFISRTGIRQYSATDLRESLRVLRAARSRRRSQPPNDGTENSLLSWSHCVKAELQPVTVTVYNTYLG